MFVTTEISEKDFFKILQFQKLSFTMTFFKTESKYSKTKKKPLHCKGFQYKYIADN